VHLILGTVTTYSAIARMYQDEAWAAACSTGDKGGTGACGLPQESEQRSVATVEHHGEGKEEQLGARSQ
jgi:hypothetical protein